MDSNPDSDHLSHVDCDPDSNPDSGPGARVNAAIESLQPLLFICSWGADSICKSQQGQNVNTVFCAEGLHFSASF